MKYNDRSTLILKEKNPGRDPWESSDRENRRQQERSYKKFAKKFAKKFVKYVGVDWWECLNEKDRDEVYDDYKEILRNSYYNRSILNWSNWIISVKSEFKPNVALYRERQINKVLR